MSRSTRVIVILCAFLLACRSDPVAPGAQVPEAEPAYRSVASVKEVMLSILDPAADAIWDSAGFIITEEGETDLSPTSEEGWTAVRSNAVVVAESGNLLMMPGRALGPDWVAFSEALITSGRQAIEAAEARDASALFDAGGEVYQACRACHDRFMVQVSGTNGAR